MEGTRHNPRPRAGTLTQRHEHLIGTAAKRVGSRGCVGAVLCFSVVDMKLPITTRYKQADGRWSAAVPADTLEQAREHVEHYRMSGYTEIDIVDADGYPLSEDALRGGR